MAASQSQQLQLQADPRTCTAAAFLLHYTNRSLIYPLRLRGGKRTALTVWAMAALFCCCNGFLQASMDVQQQAAAASALSEAWVQWAADVL